MLTVRDEEMRVNALYGTAQIPETYVIDRQGIVRRKFVGCPGLDQAGDYGFPAEVVAIGASLRMSMARAPRSMSRFEPLIGVLEHNATRRIDLHTPRRLKINIWRRLTMLHVVGCNDIIKQGPQLRTNQRRFNIRSNAIRRNRHRHLAMPFPRHVGNKSDLSDQWNSGMKRSVISLEQSSTIDSEAPRTPPHTHRSADPAQAHAASDTTPPLSLAQAASAPPATSEDAPGALSTSVPSQSNISAEKVPSISEIAIS